MVCDADFDGDAESLLKFSKSNFIRIALCGLSFDEEMGTLSIGTNGFLGSVFSEAIWRKLLCMMPAAMLLCTSSL